MSDFSINAGKGRIYRVWGLDKSKPVEMIRAPSSFVARQTYADLYKIQVFDCMSRWVDGQVIERELRG